VALWIGLAVAMAIIGWSRVDQDSFFEKMGPVLLFFVAWVVGHLFVESPLGHMLMSAVGGLIVYVVLELFFLLTHEPSRYPVNGLSHINLALIPFGAFFLAHGLSAMVAFLSTPWIVSLLSFAVFTALGYVCTAHPTADATHRWQWAGIGAWVGIMAAIILQWLPLPVEFLAAFATLWIAIPLRARRYSYQPRPSTKQLITELVVAGLLFISLLFLRSWV
jgi:hypothetical protein